MKQFFKTLGISLLIGIPLIMIIIFFLYTKDIDKETPAEEISLETADKTEGFEQLYEEEPLFEEAEVSASAAEPSIAHLCFAGDVYFSEQYLEKYDDSGIFAIVDEEMLSYMQDADLFMLNHEFSFSLRGEPMEEKEYTFRTDPKYVSILQELGTDVVTIANNHVLDFGQDAFLDTLDTLEQSKIDYVGGGHNAAEACAPLICTVNGQTFAFFAATRVSPSGDWYAGKNHPGIIQTYDPSNLNKAISEAESEFDHTIVFVHWGVERIEFPEDYQRTLAKGYIDAGADLVVGCHPHVLQGFEYYQGVPIVYSLGNYLFGNRSGETMLLQADFSPDGTLDLHLVPCKRKNGPLTQIDNAKELFSHLTDLSFGAAVSEGGYVISQ